MEKSKEFEILVHKLVCDISRLIDKKTDQQVYSSEIREAERELKETLITVLSSWKEVLK